MLTSTAKYQFTVVHTYLTAFTGDSIVPENAYPKFRLFWLLSERKRDMSENPRFFLRFFAVARKLFSKKIQRAIFFKARTCLQRRLPAAA